jgi:hypothetical protein
MRSIETQVQPVFAAGARDTERLFGDSGDSMDIEWI